MVRKVNVAFTLYLPLALITALECCNLWQCSLGFLLPMLNICADIQRFRAAALASHKLALAAKHGFKMLKSLPVSPAESLCFSQHHFSLPPSEFFNYTNEASWHYAARWLFAVSNFKLFKIEDFFKLVWLFRWVFFPGFWVRLVFVPFMKPGEMLIAQAFLTKVGWYLQAGKILQIIPPMPLKPVHHFKTNHVMIPIPDAGHQRKSSHPSSVQSSFCILFAYILDRQLKSLPKIFCLLSSCHGPEQRTRDMISEHHCRKMNSRHLISRAAHHGYFFLLSYQGREN